MGKTRDERVAERVKAELDPIDTEEMYTGSWNDQGPVHVGNLTFDPAYIVRELDPTAWRCGLNDFEDGLSRDGQYRQIDEEFYLNDEVEEIEAEIDEEIENEEDGE